MRRSTGLGPPAAELAVAAAALLPYLVVTLPHGNAVPLWDSYQYATEMIAASTGPWNLSRFNLAGHPSFLFTIPAALFAAWRGRAAAALNLWSIAVGALGIGSFAIFARRWIPSRIDRAVLAAALGACPAVTASVLQFNPDTGVFGFFLLCAAALVRGSPVGTIAAGLFLVFSKETGFLLYVALVITWSLSLGRGARRRDRVVLCVPVAAFAVYAALMRLSRASVFWHAAEKKPIGGLFLRVFGVSPSAFLIRDGYLAVVTILSFAWVPSMILIGIFIIGLFRTPSRRWWPALREMDRSDLFLVFLCTAAGGVLFAFPTFENARYLLPLFALFLLVFGAAMSRSVASAAVRRTVLAVVFALFLVSNFRTVDPVSKWFWGTFRFGDHEILAMTSVTGECCDLGRDQLVYNLEYLRFGEVLDAAFASSLSSDREAVTVFPRRAWSEVWPPMRFDRVTRHRTLDLSGIVPPWTNTAVLVQSEKKPMRVTYLAWPNTYWREDLFTLRHFYRIVGISRFSKSGYVLEAFELELRQAPAIRRDS